MGKKDKKGKAHEVAPAGEQDGDDAGHSGGLLFGSSLDTRIRPLLDAVDSIRNLLQGASLNITLPSIVVAGDQSAGKTSLLEALSGVQLPRGDDIVTRCPLILRLHLDATAKKATLSARDENGGDAGGRLAEREIALEEIDAAVREFQDILAGDQAEQGVKNLPISLDIWRPDVVDLTIIDLPGITHVATGAQPEDIAEQIKEMISEYIEPAEAVILCACPATQDITNNIVIKMARAVDPEGKRTIGVITKADLLASDTVIQSVIGAGDGRGLTFQLGCFATLARTPEQLANDTPHAEIRAAESRFFASNGAWRVVPASRLGVEALAAKLQEIQVERIRETLPNIRRAIADELAKLSKERDGLPPLMTDNPTRRAYVIKIARDIGRDIHSIWHDTGDRVDDALNAPARLKEMRELASVRMGRVCNYLGIEYGDEVKKFMVESAGRGLPNFISVPAFCQMVKTELPAYEDICLDLVQGYHEYMVAFMEEILRRNVDYAAADATFANWIESVCLGAVDRQVEVIKERLEEMFEAEAAQPITHNSYYMSTQTKVSAAIQDAREEPPKNYIREINDYRLDLSTVDISTLLSDSDEERLHYQISMHAYMKVVSKRVIDWAALMCNAKLPMFFVTKVEELVTDAVLQDDDTLERILPVDRHLLHRRTYVERTLTALREAENEIVPLFAGALPSDRGSASGLSIRGRGFRGVLATTDGTSGAGQQWDDPPLLRTPVINVQKTHVFEVAGVTLTLGLSGGEVPCPQLVPSEDIRLRFKIANREGTVLVNHSNELVSIATNGVSFPNLGVVHGVLTIYEARVA